MKTKANVRRAPSAVSGTQKLPASFSVRWALVLLNAIVSSVILVGCALSGRTKVIVFEEKDAVSDIQ